MVKKSYIFKVWKKRGGNNLGQTFAIKLNQKPHSEGINKLSEMATFLLGKD